jgi:FkbM family methyltransferase
MNYDLPRSDCSLLDRPEYLAELIAVPNPVIYEVGCNDGLDTTKILNIFPEACITCFEPDPRAIEEFKRSAGGYKCTLHECALGASHGKAIFYQSSGTRRGAYKKDWNLSGSLNNPTAHRKFSPWVQFTRVIEVEVRRLDSFKPKGSIVDLLWMDVQGGEKNVILGGREVLSRTKLIYVEFGHWEEPLYEGQMTLQETIEELGAGWKPLGVYDECNLLAIHE